MKRIYLSGFPKNDLEYLPVCQQERQNSGKGFEPDFNNGLSVREAYTQPQGEI